MWRGEQRLSSPLLLHSCGGYLAADSSHCCSFSLKFNFVSRNFPQPCWRGLEMWNVYQYLTLFQQELEPGPFSLYCLAWGMLGASLTARRAGCPGSVGDTLPTQARRAFARSWQNEEKEEYVQLTPRLCKSVLLQFEFVCSSKGQWEYLCGLFWW